MNAKKLHLFYISASENFLIWFLVDGSCKMFNFLLPTSTGYYMHIETSSPQQPGDYAKLNSPKLQFNGNMCILFYYHMYGVNVGTLTVNINGNSVFSASGNKGDKWLRAAIDVNFSGKHAVRYYYSHWKVPLFIATIRSTLFCFLWYSLHVLAGHCLVFLFSFWDSGRYTHV